jgi:hypothetical protein
LIYGKGPFHATHGISGASVLFLFVCLQTSQKENCSAVPQLNLLPNYSWFCNNIHPRYHGKSETQRGSYTLQPAWKYLLNKKWRNCHRETNVVVEFKQARKRMHSVKILEH